MSLIDNSLLVRPYKYKYKHYVLAITHMHMECCQGIVSSIWHTKIDDSQIDRVLKRLDELMCAYRHAHSIQNPTHGYYIQLCDIMKRHFTEDSIIRQTFLYHLNEVELAGDGHGTTTKAAK